MKFIQYFQANSNDIQVGILSDLGIIDIREAIERSRFCATERLYGMV